MAPQPRAKPAEVADYDSDESRIVSGTEVSAKTSKRRAQEQSSSSRTPKQGQGERGSRTAASPVPASDSGYSSTPVAGAKVAPASTSLKTTQNTSQKNTATASPAKSKPVIHRADSARSTTRAATVSNTTAKRKECTDAHCRDPNCESNRNPERRYTISSRVSMPPHPPPPQFPVQPHQDYAALPPLTIVPRPRAESINRPRPQSFHAPAGMPMTYLAGQPGPPAASAYYGYPQASYAPPQQPVYGSTPPSQSAMYPPPSTATAAVQPPPPPSSPVNKTYPGFPGTTGKLSARIGNPGVPGLVNSIAMPLPPTFHANTGPSARGDRRSVPVSYPNERRARAEDSTSSESESSDDDDRHYDHRGEQDRQRQTKRIEYQRQRSKSRRRQSTVVVEDPRRPAARKSYTTSAVPTRRPSYRESSSRPDLAYRANSDPMDNHPSSSENYDSGATAKAVIDRKNPDRRHVTTSKHSRRPSVASSYDTPPTSLSSGTGYVQAVIEDRHGRRRVYLSKDEFEALTREREREERRESQRDRLEDERLQQERIERYQKDQSAGIERQNLTATNIKQANRKSMSHVSSRSQKSTMSGSKVSRSGGMMIESHGTVLYLEEGIQEISLKADDTGATRIVVGGNGREISYNGSKSSGSRMGRSRTSRHDPIREEDGYERGY